MVGLNRPDLVLPPDLSFIFLNFEILKLGYPMCVGITFEFSKAVRGSAVHYSVPFFLLVDYI